MKIKKFLIQFVIYFSLVFVVSAIVTYLWNLIVHGQSAVDWETSFRLAIIIGIALPVHRVMTSKEK